MGKYAGMVLVLGWLVAGPGLLTGAEKKKDDPVRKELARFEGTWKFVSLQVEGMTLPKSLFQTAKLVVKGNVFTMTDALATYRGNLKVNLATKPRQLDLVFTGGPEKGKTSLAIYELDGDRLKICLGLAGKTRPTAFVTKSDSGHVLEVLQREKATANTDAVKKELERMQGTWQLVSAETDGKKTPADQVKKIKVVIQGNQHTVFFGGKALVKKVTFRIDPTRKPRTVTDVLGDGRTIRGIYELEGDTLRSCVARVGKKRPAQFAAEAGSGYTLRVFKRVTDKARTDPK